MLELLVYQQKLLNYHFQQSSKEVCQTGRQSCGVSRCCNVVRPQRPRQHQQAVVVALGNSFFWLDSLNCNIVDEKIVLVRQYRPALEMEMLEIPAGKLDIEGERPEKAAHRELIEEAGLDASRLEELCSFYNSAGFSDEKTIIYLATEMTRVEKNAASVEEQYMTTEKVPLEDIHEMIDSGYITDAKTIIGIYSALRFIGK